MQIEKIKDGNTLTIALEGRLDTMTSPELEAALDGAFAGLETLVFDLAKLDYIFFYGVFRCECHNVKTIIGYGVCNI